MCLKVVIPGYETFVLHQNIEHFDSNLNKNHHSYWQTLQKVGKLCPKFLTVFKFRTLEETVPVTLEVSYYREAGMFLWQGLSAKHAT